MKDKPRVYLARAGRNGEDEEAALDKNLAIIGFQDVPSLEQCGDYKAVLQVVREAIPDGKPRALGNFAGQLWAFAYRMKLGDLVVLPRKLTRQIAIGRVTGPYRYAKVNSKFRHTRAIEWLRSELSRTTFEQDLLHSFGAFMTVCRISRHNAVERVQEVLAGKADPGRTTLSDKDGPGPTTDDDPTDELPDLAQSAHDQIVAQLQARFSGHSLAHLVSAVLVAEGWVTTVSPPGPDGGVDILAGSGSLGLDAPRLCVQVKSQNSPTDVTVYRTLKGVMPTFNAQFGLLVCWGGFNKAVLKEARSDYFSVRLWDSSDLVEAIYRSYDRLPAEIQAELPLKQVWMLVPEGSEE